MLFCPTDTVIHAVNTAQSCDPGLVVAFGLSHHTMVAGKNMFSFQLAAMAVMDFYAALGKPLSPTSAYPWSSSSWTLSGLSASA